MQPLDKDLQQQKSEFREFGDLTKKVLHYLPHVLSSFNEKNEYRIYSSQIAGTTKFIRPINNNLFYFEPIEFGKNLAKLNQTFEKINNHAQRTWL